MAGPLLRDSIPMKEERNENTSVIAFCYSCGGDKSDYLAICESCKAIPTNEDQILISMCSTSDLTDPIELEKARRSISNGKSLKIAPEAKKFLLQTLREEGMDINEIMAGQIRKK